MPRSLLHPQRIFPIAVAISAVLALLPAKWLRWTSDVAAVVTFPMRPFAQVGRTTAEWLRPPERLAATESEQRLLEEIDRFKRLYLAEQNRAAELELHLQQLQSIPIERRPGVSWIIANVSIGGPRSPGAVVDVNRGTRHGVEPGTIAVYGGVHLVGRVVEGVSGLSSRIEPITAIDLIGARIIPRDAREMRLEHAPLVQLRTQGDGTFRADSVPRDQPVRPGDIVRLDDRRDWPASAQMMILGEVESITPNDKDPLRSIVIIRPQVHLRNLATVTLCIESRETELAGGRSGSR